MPIKENIKQFREKMNMSQELLAEKMDVTRQAVSKWESGECKPSTQNLLTLAHIFNVAVDELITSSSKPMKESKKIKVVNWVKILSILSLMLAFAPIAVALIAHNFLSDTIPMHYNGAGEIDRYGSKNEMLILAGGLSLFVIVITIALIVIKYNKNNKIIFLLSSVAVSITFIIMQISFTIKAVNEAVVEPLTSFEMMQLMCILFNILMMFFGIALPFTSQNRIFGLRITSTLKSKENWVKTHKLAGFTIVIASIVGALFAAFISGYIALISLFFLAVGIVIPIIYSVKKVNDNN
ncbi:MAG: helix-turn-helix domain-containing protein [Clostridia bacterium]